MVHSQCAQGRCSSKLSWKSAISLLSIILPGPYSTGFVVWISFPIWIPELQGDITPLPALISHAIHMHCTFMDQRSQALLPPLPNPLPYSKFLVISAPNLKPRLFLNHLLSNEAIFSHFREARNTRIYSLHSISLDI